MVNVFPNPTLSSSSIKYTLKDRAKVSLMIYDILGKKVETIVLEEFQDSGDHFYNFSSPRSGVYFVKLFVNDSVDQVMLMSLH
jgi:hypothetical protein